ncbi:TonB-dependent receptor [Herbaspirillum sp. SJZ107]|uniref:TonB-dependent receptor n=1 Tax=Herbaspirillum sp. SJZ107 TaxID=2572881 RepID=UPI00116EC81C|nr:TonB-dependent receptor [Herbaspirillum sp. SJZ107]TQK03161.1 iron complex outermembrane receptor protein [Herbaspirillum sp. SJZ107]
MKKQWVRLNPTLLAASIAGIASFAVPFHAAAQAQPSQQAPSADGTLPEVIVTAQRSAAPASRTPVAMSVLTAAQLDQQGIDSPGAIADRLPNTYLQNSYDGLRITMRGVSNADATEKGDPSAAYLVDGVYVARPQAQNASFYDVERIEVLRGPQGTLYGRNTTAGAVNVISKAPVPYFEAAANATVGSYDTRQLGGMVNVPVSDVLALRAAFTANRHDPYLRNGQGTGYRPGLDRDDRAARLSASWRPGHGITAIVRYETGLDNTNNDSTVPDTNFYSGLAQGKPVWNGDDSARRLTNRFKSPNNVPDQGFSHKTSSSLTADVSWDLGPATLSWLGSHRNFEHDYLYNYFYRVAPSVALGVRQNFHGDYKQDSHELRIATNSAGPLSAQGGVYWFHENVSDHYTFRDLKAAGLTPYYVFDNDPVDAWSRAVFGQATYALSPRLRATAGARYTEDDKSRYGYIGYQQAAALNMATDPRELNAGAISSNKTTWRLALDYDLAPGTLLYGSLATGYKSGGFNDGCSAGAVGTGRLAGVGCPAASAVPAHSLVYQPETLRALEAGLKTRFWDSRASLNLAVFHYDYRNLQLSSQEVINGKPRYETTNAGEAKVRGLEADGQVRVTAADRVTYALSLLDAHYTSYRPDATRDLSGTRLDRAPARTLALGYEHRFALPGGSLVLGGGTRASAAYILSVPSKGLVYRIPGHTESDLRLCWEPRAANWSLLARVRNLENAVRPLTINSTGITVPSDPRTGELRLDYRF